MKTHLVENVTLHLAHADQLDMEWVGRRDLMRQLLAAWLVVDTGDLPLNPRLVGKPGVGKTTLACGAARELGRPVWVYQATMDTRPEDLLVTPVVGPNGSIQYAASPLVTAMIEGGICVLDEGNRMSEKSWASLAPLLDARRYVESVVAGVKVAAHPDFRICVTMNDDASTFDIPEYIHSRLQPQILIEFPDEEEERLILQRNVPFAPPQVLDYVVSFLSAAHSNDEPFTVRDGINVARYALKRLSQEPGRDLVDALSEAARMTLGEDGAQSLQRGGTPPPHGPRELGDDPSDAES